MVLKVRCPEESPLEKEERLNGMGGAMQDTLHLTDGANANVYVGSTEPAIVTSRRRLANGAAASDLTNVT